MLVVSGKCTGYKGIWVNNNGKRKIVKDDSSSEIEVNFSSIIYHSHEQFIVELSKNAKKALAADFDIFIDKKTITISEQENLPSYSENFESIYEGVL